MKNQSAFPQQQNGGDIYGGLTKLEYFAGLVMQGICANGELFKGITSESLMLQRLQKTIPVASVQIAKAIIEQLEQEVGNG